MTSTDADTGAAAPPELGQPATYPRTADLRLSCSVVMKGGITSGVIYPRTVCQLAVRHKLVNVGGTSAGAIAAAAAAAAEYGRDAGAGTDGSNDVGYPRLASLPNTLTDKLDGHTRLYHLFQAQDSTKALYRLAAVWIGRGAPARKVIASIIPLLLILQPLPAVTATLTGAVLLAGAIWLSNWVAVVLAVLLALVVMVIAVGWSLMIRATNDLPKNHFGLCSGMNASHSSVPGLTEWLAAEIDRIAGVAADRHPLTFGDLESRGITLSMLTTDLSSGTQNELPFRSQVWAFKADEFADLFPGNVVRWLTQRSDALPGNPAFDRLRAKGYSPLPPPADIPVIVGVRMSLSFPVLLSTVPLYAIDYTTPLPDATDPVSSETQAYRIACHRFSDGGITSNFPLTFFDAAVPDRPTFAINLVEVDQLSDNQADNVWMPTGNNQGILTRPTHIDSVGGFVHALLNTLQNWTDSMQAHVPGYRDRIVAVKQTKTEGGMNLDMAGPVIEGLAERGQYAGLRTDSFDFTNHRWLRFRSLLQTLEEFITPAEQRLQGPGPCGGPSYDGSAREGQGARVPRIFLSHKSRRQPPRAGPGGHASLLRYLGHHVPPPFQGFPRRLGVCPRGRPRHRLERSGDSCVLSGRPRTRATAGGVPASRDGVRGLRPLGSQRGVAAHPRRAARPTAVRAGRDQCPTAAIIDSQTVPAADTVPRSSRGWDGGKRTNGVKRHIAVEVNGLLLAVVVTAAPI